MLVIPAIDLYQGKVVRLRKGDKEQLTVYGSDPVAMAKHWQDEGAKLLHVVDLSAAFDEGDNRLIIKDIVKAVDIDVEAGGGIRDLNIAKELMGYGVSRIIIGTKAIDESFLNSIIETIGPKRIALGIDVKDGKLAICGWRQKTEFEAIDFIKYLQTKGIEWVIYTDISRDGTMEGVDIAKINSLSIFKNMKFIASGGVSSLKDIENLREKTPFVWGVITGKALYEGTLRFSEIA
jgi:phosphoribosylformimino-5-aminoimidazole carboxamide ribotide isomerase